VSRVHAHASALIEVTQVDQAVALQLGELQVGLLHLSFALGEHLLLAPLVAFEELMGAP
jgi:hypothetical protein